ncbi:MAG: RNA polymerase sigma-70 factor [Anaerolineae bacterium]|nr:RNA polymerase sigma-70 factor [Anaerolineae bacterium]
MTATFEQWRPKLFAIAYRMLGSSVEAEDVVQDAYLRYLAISSAEKQDIDSEEAWLRTVAIRLALDRLKSARMQRETYVGPWLPEPVRTDHSNWIDPADATEQYDSLSMAFLLLLESLTPDSRAVFLLRQVFEYDYGEIALILGKSEANCRQLFSRARKLIDAQRSRLRNTPDEHRALLEQCISAFQAGDVSALMELMAEDVVSQSDGGGKVSAATKPLQGKDHVTKLLLGLRRFIEPGMTFEIAMINGREGIINWKADGTIDNVMIFTVAEGKIQSVFIVRNPDKLTRLT